MMDPSLQSKKAKSTQKSTSAKNNSKAAAAAPEMIIPPPWKSQPTQEVIYPLLKKIKPN